jgi:hypothetical protein
MITAPVIDVPRMGSDQVLHKITETAQRGIIKWYSLGQRWVDLGHGLYPMTIDVV